MGLASHALAQSPQVTLLLKEGAPIEPPASINFFLNAGGNSHREPTATVVTDLLSSMNEFFVTTAGPLPLQEGDGFSTPAGFGTIDNFLPESDSDISDGSDVIVRVNIEPLDGDALILNNELLVFGRNVGGTPADLAGFPAGSTYKALSGPRINTARQVLFPAPVGVGPSTTEVLVRAQVTGASTLGEQIPVARVGELKPGLSSAIENIGSNDNDEFALNEAGQALYTVGFGGNQSAILLDDQVMVQSGDIEPVTGATWTELENIPVAMNDNGDWAVLGGVSGAAGEDEILAVNGSALVRKGQTLPDIDPFVITGFLGTGIEMDEDGNVAWIAEIDHPLNNFQHVLFLNDELLVQSGVTEVNGETIVSLLGGNDNFAPVAVVDLSVDGRFLYFLAVLQGGQSALLLISPEATVNPMSECFGNSGQISLTDGQPAIGSQFTLSLDNGQSPGAFALLWIATEPTPGWPGTGCGIPLAGFGELLIDVLPPNPVVSIVDVWDGTPTDFDLPVADAVNLIGLELYAQGVFGDPLNVVEMLRFTGGLALTVGDAP